MTRDVVHRQRWGVSGRPASVEIWRSDVFEASDEDGFEQVFHAFYGRVHGYVRRRLGHPALAEDVAAEVFVTLWRRRAHAPQGAEDLLPWLFGVARKLVANQNRGHQRSRRLAERLRRDLTARWATADVESLAGLSQEAAEAYRGLSAADREVLALVAWEGFDTGQIALPLGCSTGAARVRLHRARCRLENRMRNHG